jgi:D-aspartate ligase
MNLSNKKGVVVIGGHVQSLGIIRTFGRNGIPCYVLDNTGLNISKHSKYCTKFIKMPTSDIINFLISLNKKHNLNDWLLIPTDDYHVKLLSQNKNILKPHYRVSIDDWEVIQKCYNKIFTYKIAQNIGIPLPKTHFPNCVEDLINIDIDYPCILKPAVMHKLYSQLNVKVLVCNTYEELVLNYNKILLYIPPDEVIVQEIIPGDNDNQYSACFFFNRMNPIVSFLVRRRRQYPIGFGSCSSYVETVSDMDRFKDAESLLREINFMGICEVEFKKDYRDGLYKFLEINPRTWKHISLSTKSNSPILMSLYNYVYFGKEDVINSWDDCCWNDLIIDNVVKIKMLLRGMSIKSPKHKNTEYAVFDMDDIMPFLFEVLFTPYLFITR